MAANPGGKHSEKRRGIVIALALAAVTAGLFWQVVHHSFLFYDDNIYVTQNAVVRSGLTVDGVRAAFGTFMVMNWHPLTIISHMLDVELFGLHPGRHHLVSAGLHVFNALVLFFLLRAMTGKLWRSALVAALFAVHPLHVESVAWVSERKDVLSTSFWFLAMAAYLRYARAPSTGRYLLVAALTALGLMSKPMVVTLPLILLLADFWPLSRWRGASSGPQPPPPESRTLARLVIEKLPLAALAAGAGLLTLFAQRSFGALQELERYSLPVRIGNALLSYVKYILKTLWPVDLTITYHHPGRDLPVAAVLLAGVLLAIVTALSLKHRRRAPALAFGWLWYLVTLAPVIGIVQVGQQAMADRYTYIPLVGFFVAAVWGGADLLKRCFPVRQHIVSAAAAVLLLLPLLPLTYRQVGYYHDSLTLFSHALEVRPDSWVAHNQVGTALDRRGEVDGAIRHYRQALRYRPGYSRAHTNLGAALMKKQDLRQAIFHFQEALRTDPTHAEAHYNLGVAYLSLSDGSRAAYHLEETLRLSPGMRGVRPMLDFARKLEKR